MRAEIGTTCENSQSLENFVNWTDYDDAENTRAHLMMYSLKLKMGDERFDAFIKAYSARYSLKIATKEDFMALAEEFYGERLESFFNDWLYGKELPPLETP